jgi:Icc-related predicted phosphoesterase
MTIIALTDLHSRTGIISNLTPQLQSADLILLCGDITHFGRKNTIIEIIQQLRSINNTLYAVTGNCDYPEVEKYLVKEGISLNAMCKGFAEFVLIGLSGSLPCPGKTPNEYTEEEYKILLNNMSVPSDKPLLMVSHQPPFGTLNDQVAPQLHVGSHTIRSFIEVHQPLICFTGHIHEGIGIDYIGNTTIVNPGPAGMGNYSVAEMERGSIKNIHIRNISSKCY